MLLQNIRYEFIIVQSGQSCLATKSRVYSPKFRSMYSFYTSIRRITLLCFMYMVGIFMNCDFLQRRSTNPFGIYSDSLFVNNITAHSCFWLFIYHKQFKIFLATIDFLEGIVLDVLPVLHLKLA